MGKTKNQNCSGNVDPRTCDTDYTSAEFQKPWALKYTKYADILTKNNKNLPETTKDWEKLHQDNAAEHKRCGMNDDGTAKTCGCNGSASVTGYPREHTSDCDSSVNCGFIGYDNGLGASSGYNIDHDESHCQKCHTNGSCGGCAWPGDNHNLCLQTEYKDEEFNNCCSKTDSSKPTEYCHPQWSYLSEACTTSSATLEYCSGKDSNGKSRLLTDPKCDRNSKFAKVSGGSIRDKAIDKYCSDNKYPEECYCVAPDKAPIDSKVGTDVYMNTLLGNQGGKVGDERNITCWSNECLDSSKRTLPSDSKYMLTTELLYPDCTNIPEHETICDNIINVIKAGGKVDITKNEFQSTCGSSMPTKRSLIKTIALIGTAVLIVVIIVIVLLRKSK